MWIVLILTCTVFIFLYRKLRLPLQYWKDRGILHPSPSIILGNLGPIVRRKETLNKLLQKTCSQYEDHRYFGFYEFSKPELVILDRELIKDIFVKNFDSFTDHFDFLPKDVDTFWKKGLFAREGNDWHDMRVTLSPTFTSKKMKAMFYLVAECSKRFVDHFLKENKTVTLEIMEAFCKFNNDVIASCTFGIHCDSLKNENNEFNVMATEAFNFSGLKSWKFFGNSLSPTLSRVSNILLPHCGDDNSVVVI
ncbi:hypothetical protein FQR65_LT08279 [Abscondita terminalis]|nr:hypothetical protein FQR65_LT08279 [Abscondita terminalis]